MANRKDDPRQIRGMASECLHNSDELVSVSRQRLNDAGKLLRRSHQHIQPSGSEVEEAQAMENGDATALYKAL